MNLSADVIRRELEDLQNPQRALFSLRFFKTAPGEYAEGDLFRGIAATPLRRIAKEYRDLSLKEVRGLLRSEYHEDRLVALLILIHHYDAGTDRVKKMIYELYLKNTKFINNWDLVDASAPHIVGAYLWDKDRKPLSKLALSKILWERRIAILATFHFIKRGDVSETLKLALLLLSDPEDLIHKAVGWMLREVGKRNAKAAESFLRTHYPQMPRTMLRYAIEKYPPAKRRQFLEGRL